MIRNLLVTLALAIAIAAPVAAEPPLADRLPADAIAYIGWDGRNHAFDGSHLGALLEQCRISLTASAPDDASLTIPQRLGCMAALAARHKMALCVMESAAPDAATPNVALVIDLGKDRPAFDEHLQIVWSMIAMGTEVAEVTAGPVPYKTATIGSAEVATGYIDDMAFIALGGSTADKLIALRDAADRSLLNAPGFTAAHETVAGENEQLSIYLDLPASLKALQQVSPKMARRVTRQLAVVGLGQATAYVSSVRVVDRCMYRKTRVLAPGPLQGIAALLAGEPLDPADLAAAPADASGVLAWKINPAEAKAQLLWSLARHSPHTVESLEQAEAKLKQSCGIDLTACVGSRAMLVHAPSVGGLFTGTALVVELADAAALTEALDRAHQQYGQEAIDLRDGGIPLLRRTQVGETTLGYLAMPPTANSGAPAWAIHNNTLIVAAWPQVVIAMIEKAGEPGLTAKPALQAAWARLTSAPMTVGYVDVPALVEQFYGIGLAAWAKLSGKLPRGAIWLPSLPSMKAHLSPTISGLSADADGLTGESFGAVPSGLADPLLICLAAGEAINFAAFADGGSRQREAAAQMRRIGEALAAYASQHEGSRPADLQALVAAGLLGPDVDIRSYTYIALPPDAEDHLILAYRLPTDPQGRAAVLFADGNAATMPVDTPFMDLVELSKAAGDKSP